MEKIRLFIFKFKSFCLVLFAILSVVVVILALHRKLVSPYTMFGMEYPPDIVFLNTPAIDTERAVSQIFAATDYFAKNKNIMEADIEKMRDTINALGWIENVAIERQFPNKLRFVVRSKDIIAYKFKNNQYYPITSHGEQLEKPAIFTGGLIVLGDNAAPEIPDILQKIKRYKRLYDSLIAVRYINDIRFNLILYSFDSDGMIIKLNKDFSSGIDKLMELDALQGILSRNISEIDLRDTDKVLVKPR